MFTSEMVRSWSDSELLFFLSGDSWYPVTVQLLECVAEVHRDNPSLHSFLAISIGSPFIAEETLDWISAFAERSGDLELWSRSVTDANAAYSRMLTAPADSVSPHGLQAFVLKHSLATGRLWSEAEYGRLRRFCEDAALGRREGNPTLAQVVGEVIESAAGRS